MCGILGAFGAGVDEAGGLRALDGLAHRGPDGAGHRFAADEASFLGHRRLAIVDLSDAGRQPMASEDGSLWLVFNGEVYGHAALRAELEARGHAFRSRCDAEVVLHLYEEEGDACVERLRGMFAFGLWDARRRRLLLARDRLGIKPLVWYEDGARFAFASELGALRRLPGLDLEPDPTAYYDYLTYRFVPAPKTVHRRVRKLPAAHRLVWTPGSPARVERWWDVDFAPDPELDGAQAEERLGEALDEALALHLEADVEVASFLSAGTDSALVTASATRLAGRPPRCFTVGFPERDDDEADEAAAIARRLGAEHRVLPFGVDAMRASAGEMAGLFDEPFADHAALPMLGLCRGAAEHVKVVLSGDGGDETHGGYGRYRKHARRAAAYARAERVPGLRALARTAPAGALPWLRALAEEPLGRPHAFHLGIPREAKRRILDLGPELEGYDDYWLVREHRREDLPPLARAQHLDLRTLLPDGHLTKVDRVAMRFGLEVRPPLLDHRLVELAARLPEGLRLGPDGRGKPLLRALLRARLPGPPLDPPKRGFSVPLRRFVRDEGLFRLARDVDVLGAFRIRADAVERTFSPDRGYHERWMLWVLADFLQAERA